MIYYSPAQRYYAVFRYSLHNLHHLFSVSSLTSFQALLSCICSIMDIMSDAFLSVKFCFTHISHFLSWFLWISFCISFLLCCPTISFLTTFFHSLSCLHVGLNFLSSPLNYTALHFFFASPILFDLQLGCSLFLFLIPKLQ